MKVRLLSAGLFVALLLTFGLATAQAPKNCRCKGIGKKVNDKVRVSGVVYTVTVVSLDIDGCDDDDCDKGACFWHWEAVAENGFEILKNVITKCETATSDPEEAVDAYGKAREFSISGLYPNPIARGQEMRLVVNSDGGKLQLDVFSIDGKSMRRSWYFEDGRTRHEVILNTSGLAQGVYMVRLGTGAQAEMHRLVVQ